MTRLMDVNPFKKGTRGREEIAESIEKDNITESRFKKVKNYCAYYCQNNWKIWLAFLVLLFVCASIFIFYSSSGFSNWPYSAISSIADKNKWQAVFLNNGQIYFGHLNETNKDYMILSDVYYLKVSPQAQSSQQSQQPQQQINLVKLGEEIYGPEDTLYIFKSQITHWENIKLLSPVSQAIKQIESGNKKQ